MIDTIPSWVGRAWLFIFPVSLNLFDFVNTSLPILTHLEHRIRVAKILLDISHSTYGAGDANIKQHLAELLNSRRAFSQPFAVSTKELGKEKAPKDLTYNLNRHKVHGDSQLTHT